MTYKTLKDAGGNVVNILAQLITGSTYAFGNFQAAVPEGGCSAYQNLDVDETGENIKASAGQVYTIAVSNSAALSGSDTGDRYLKLYNKATAATSGDTPVWTIRLGPGDSREVSIPTGLAFATGISIRATRFIGASDNFAPNANEVSVSIAYK